MKVKKINQGQLLLSFVLLCMISFTLYKQFDNFVFHAYETRIYRREMYRGSNDDLTVDYYSLIQDDEGYQFGDAKLIIKNDHFISSTDEIEVVSSLLNKKYSHTLTKIDDTTYKINALVDGFSGSLDQIVLEINNKTTNQSETISLAPVNMGIYSGLNKEFSYKEFYVYKDRIILGSINCANLEKYQENYDQVRLEYRYQGEGQDTPVVYYTRQGTLEEIFNKTYLENVDVSLLEGVDLNSSKLSVVVILKGEDDLAFSIDLTNESEVN